jgi:hypothetical protein
MKVYLVCEISDSELLVPRVFKYFTDATQFFDGCCSENSAHEAEGFNSQTHKREAGDDCYSVYLDELEVLTALEVKLL